jgi:hypothetical protein
VAKTRSRRPLAVAAVVAVLGLTAPALLTPAAVGQDDKLPAKLKFEPRRFSNQILPGLAVPFPCGQTWAGSTRLWHSPNAHAVDFNRTNDEGSPVAASAAGVVTKAYDTLKGGYGKWVVVDHGGGVTTLYAHLKKTFVVPGQSVDQGGLLGLVGSTGNSTGAHLHYEQLLGKDLAIPAFAGFVFGWGPVASANCLDVPVAGRFSATSVESQVAVYQRDLATGFSINDPAGAVAVRFGGPVDEPLIGDWDGDGIDDLGVRAPRGRAFKLKTAAGITKTKFGMRFDKPVSGDWAGTGLDQLGVYRPRTGTFHLRQADATVTVVAGGDANDVPVTGDWNGDGRDDVGVYDRATATFTLHVLDPALGTITSVVPFGLPGDLPVVADWDGNGTTDLGSWTPSTATFTQGSGASVESARTVIRTVQFGRPR